MGLSALDCPLCGGWDGPDEYPNANVEMPDGSCLVQLCKKCAKKKVKEGGRQYHWETKRFVVYDTPDKSGDKTK